MKVVKIILRILLPVAIVGGAYFGYLEIMARAPKPNRRKMPTPTLVVDAIRVQPQDFQVTIESQGTVRPKTQSTLIPEVDGKIVQVAPALREGSFFEKDDILVEIDPRDYEVAVTLAESILRQSQLDLERVKVSALTKEAMVAESKAQLSKMSFALEQERINAKSRDVQVSLASADVSKAAAGKEEVEVVAEGRHTTVIVADSNVSQATLSVEQEKVSAESKKAQIIVARAKLESMRSLLKEEEARARQAEADWKAIGVDTKPGELALRIPQLSAARAAVSAAEAELKQAELDNTLGTTEIKNAEIGVTAAGARLNQAKLDLKLSKPQIATAMAELDAARAQLKLMEQDLQLAEPQIASAKASVDASAAQLKQTELDLTLVKSQIETAEAVVKARTAQLAQAKLNLERTRIRAPYAGRVLERNVDLGQTVSKGTTLATIYGVDFAEVRLPVTNRQVEYLDMPYLYRGDSWEGETRIPAVVLKSSSGRQQHQWKGKVVRAEGAIDVRSRQLFLVAEVIDPYGKRDGQPPLKVGQFVESDIEGRKLENVIVIPRSAIREGQEVLVVEETSDLASEQMKGKSPPTVLVKRKIEILWGSPEIAVVAGLPEGSVLCTSPISFAGESVKVVANIAGEEPRAPVQAEEKDAGARESED